MSLEKFKEAEAVFIKAYQIGSAENDWLKVKITPKQWDIEVKCER